MRNFLVLIKNGILQFLSKMLTSYSTKSKIKLENIGQNTHSIDLKDLEKNSFEKFT
jgi:hypothetical protein